MAQVLITETTLQYYTGVIVRTRVVCVPLGAGKLLDMSKNVFIRIMESQEFNFNPDEHAYGQNCQTGSYYDTENGTMISATLLD